MTIMPIYHLRLRTKLGRLHRGAEVMNFGVFNYHGDLLVDFGFGFWCVVCQILYVGTLDQDWNVPQQQRQ